MGPLFLINEIKNNPGFNFYREFPKGYMAVTGLANSIFIIFVVYVLVCGFMFYRRWKTRPVRHKAFMAMTASYLLIMLISMMYVNTRRVCRAYIQRLEKNHIR